MVNPELIALALAQTQMNTRLGKEWNLNWRRMQCMTKWQKCSAVAERILKAPENVTGSSYSKFTLSSTALVLITNIQPCISWDFKQTRLNKRCKTLFS